MDSVPLHIQIGAILGIISSIVLLILHLPQLGRMIISFLRKSFVWLRGRPLVIREFLWWRQCRPLWWVGNIGKAIITKEDNVFNIEIPIEIMYKNRDERYETQIQFDRVVFLMSHLGRGKERSPFELRSRQQQDIGVLEPMEIKQVSYVCAIKTPAKPLLGETTKCRVTVRAEAWILTVHIHMCGKLKRKGNSIVRVPIIWDIKDGNDWESKQLNRNGEGNPN